MGRSAVAEIPLWIWSTVESYLREWLENRERTRKSMWTTGPDGPFDAYFTQCLALLAPLFEPVHGADVRELFELVCCLVHPAGVEGLDENPLFETTALIEDLIAFSSQNQLVTDFDHPERTRSCRTVISQRETSSIHC